jgi:hypothetical protein
MGESDIEGDDSDNINYNQEDQDEKLAGVE